MSDDEKKDPGSLLAGYAIAGLLLGIIYAAMPRHLRRHVLSDLGIKRAPASPSSPAWFTQRPPDARYRQ